jgi:CheY-like chemotaxis protein
MSDKTVLYVEDNEYNLKIVRQLLGRTSYRLIEAVDGQLGVETALRELPDLILMDIQLPKVSGLDATRRLRAIPDRRHSDYRDHLFRAQRRRPEGEGCWRLRLPVNPIVLASCFR